MAYGKVRGISKLLGEIPARIYPIESNASESRAAILTVPVDFNAGDELDAKLVEKLHHDFNEAIDEGRTYPQEDIMDVEAYKNYFMSYDLVLGLILTKAQLESLHSTSGVPKLGVPLSESQLSNVKVGSSKIRALSQSSARASIDLPNQADTYAFVYYIKPNYPGRSSHLCNGGFMVPSGARGLGLGRIAARSFCFYGPAVGYRGSVFNLVYASNEASVRLWTKLGFTNVGRIPEAGRLKKVGGGGEEYADAWVVHGDFRKIGYRDNEEQGGVGLVTPAAS
ncbi:uncharacterized protein CC84DRAFT_1164015 [Paraphaeosphaeria sporulosa]|uniref:N-acetyltransferase domain-containing protein n=1 Tax=Paraphaeosphaeria sporulosa TaxID=1460663 RepID=A0A177CFA3_9PLEO|nr:uncharacterized protein CC84DRAFT_1164015 [Paraphaeosphaeria sporulosa]OAG05498.1 hypothetical protein CC84DRAFT_1164015 [Paraphaeosphaeria sporulosa]